MVDIGTDCRMVPMPPSLTQYRIFLAASEGMTKERQRFRQVLGTYTATNSQPLGVAFVPVGPDDEDLRHCDYAVFLLPDRREPALGLAAALYDTYDIRNIWLFSRTGDAARPLSTGLVFGGNAEGPRYRRFTFGGADSLADILEQQLARSLRAHVAATTDPSKQGDRGGIARSHLRRFGDAIAAFDTLHMRLGGATDADARHRAGQARVNKGLTLAAMGREEEAIAVYDDLLAAWSETEDEAVGVHRANALYYRGVALAALGRHEDAAGTFDRFLARYRNAPDTPDGPPVALTYSGLGGALMAASLATVKLGLGA